MSTRYQLFYQAPMQFVNAPSLPLRVRAADPPLELLVYTADAIGNGLLPDIPFHTHYDGGLLIDANRVEVDLDIVTRHRLASGLTFDSVRRTFRLISAQEIADLRFSDFDTISSVPRRAVVTDTGGASVTISDDDMNAPCGIDVIIRLSGYDRTDLTMRADLSIMKLELTEDAGVSWWQLYATLDRPPQALPVPAADTGQGDAQVGAAHALLRLQRALVARFAAAVGGPDGVADAFADAGVSMPPADLPPAVLYDEPPAGLASYWRLGDAAVTVETRAGGVLWEMQQDIEAHVDPVRGRAAALVMGSVMESAFAAGQMIGTAPHDPPVLLHEPWVGAGALALRGVGPSESPRDSASPVRVVDIRQTDSRIGWSEAGLSYQVIGTWAIVMEPVR